MAGRAFLVSVLLVFSGVCIWAAAPPVAEPNPLPPGLLDKPATPSVYLGDDLGRVPEVRFEAPPAEKWSSEDWVRHTSRRFEQARRLNNKRRDGFVEALMRARSDLAGLPFRLGDACRTSHERDLAFEQEATMVRTLGSRSLHASPPRYEPSAEARIAALTQILAEEDAKTRLGLVEYLSASGHERATRELARLAIFDPDESVRTAALEALPRRPARDSRETLAKAVSYPWPAVSERAARAIVKLRRTDLLPRLVAFLDEPDPRMPRTETGADGKVYVTEELVRINHHKNCMLCHAPGVKGSDEFLRQVPDPTKPLSPPEDYYGNPQRRRSEDLPRVRVGVVYLRQDFSLMQPVENAKPWPAVQRFDFVVRKRVLSDDEAKDLRERLKESNKDGLSPHRRAALRALRALTGRDAGTKASAWREVLKFRQAPAE